MSDEPRTPPEKAGSDRPSTGTTDKEESSPLQADWDEEETPSADNDDD